MSKPSRLVKPSKQSRKELPGNRSQMLIVGERLMRAGSEGNLVRPRSAQQQDQQQPAHGQDQSTKMLTNPEKQLYIRLANPATLLLISDISASRESTCSPAPRVIHSPGDFAENMRGLPKASAASMNYVQSLLF
ncbi:hypothetical protein MHYP_G00231990 [Metynnis hypsauchen]